MTESLHTHLVSTLRAAGINPALSEDEIDGYPYVTFELPVEYRYDKDGVYKIVGNLTIRSVSDDIDEAETLQAGIERAIASGFDGEPVIPVEEVGNPAEAQEDVELEEATAEEVIEEDPGDEPIPEEPAEAEDDTPSEPVTGTIYTARLTDVRKDCMDGIWVIELDYILNQI